MCDFSIGFKPPEMVKTRPVIAIATGAKSVSGLVTVVPLSKTAPHPILGHHLLLDSKYLPRTAMFRDFDSWVKGDMIYTVGHHRLSPVGLGRIKGGKREYLTHKLSREQMTDIYACVLHGLNLGNLAQFL